MSDQRLQEIESRLKAATDMSAEKFNESFLNDGWGTDTSAMLSHAPADMAYLLAEVKRLPTLLTMGKPIPRGLEAAIANETAINKAQVKEDW